MPTYGLYLSTLVHGFSGIYVRKLSKVIDKKIELRGYKCDKKIYNPSYFKDDFFKEENIKYRVTDISINEINNFFLNSLNDALYLKIEEIKNELLHK